MIFSLFAASILSLLATSACQQNNSNSDISSVIKSGTCMQDKPTGLRVKVAQDTINISWSLVDTSARFLDVLYLPKWTTTYTSKRVDSSIAGSPVQNTALSNLLPFTNYIVYVRVNCDPEYGPLSDAISFQTPPTEPSQTVTNLMVSPAYGGVRSLVLLEWQHIPQDTWNGPVGGYYVYLYVLPNTVKQSEIIQVYYPQNQYLLGLPDGTYAVQILTFNGQGLVTKNGTVSQNFSVGSYMDRLEYPVVYIIVPGLVFIVIIIVIIIVMCKMAQERKKRTITYCKDIVHNPKGYTNAMPLQTLHSPSVSISPALTSAPAMSTNTHMPLATRPLPLSPTPPPPSSPTSQLQDTIEKEPLGFGNGLATNFQPPKKLPHPGPLPQLSEGAVPDFLPMQRSLTNQSASSVFTTTGVSSQRTVQAPPTQRQRARTVGGSIPSPYEVPEHNGNTLSKSDISASRPSSAHSTAHHRVGGAGLVHPTPPAHSPPPLTQSSMELRARMDTGQKTLVSPPNQNTLPRLLHQPHSGGRAKNHPQGMKQMRSEGHFPIFESEEKGEQDKLAHSRPPMDSSTEASTHGRGGYAPRDFNEVDVARRPSIDRTQYTAYQAANGSVTDSETMSSFSEMTDPRSAVGPHAPPHGHVHHMPDRERSMQSQGRESLFSETSIELSISSSERELSPAWDYRGATSDIGVGLLRGESSTPEGRETASEVVAGLKGRPTHVFKQV